MIPRRYKKDGPEGPPFASFYRVRQEASQCRALIATTKDVQDTQEHVDDVHEQVDAMSTALGSVGGTVVAT